MSEISVIVPCYKAEKTLAKCVNSLTSQTFRDIEIILVNDCSPDSTGELCESLQKNDSRIKTIHMQKNSGPSATRNAGLDVAQGRWVAFVDSDDWIEPETYEIALKYAEKHSAAHVVWSYVSEYGSNIKEKKIYDSERVFKSENSNQLFIDVLGPTGNRLTHPEHIHSLSSVCCKLFLREVIVENQLVFYDLEKIGIEDLHFSASYLNCIQGKTSVYIDKCFYHYIKANSASLSTKYKPQYTHMAKAINNELKSIARGRADEKDCIAALKNRTALSLINIGLNEVSSTDNAFCIIKRLQKVLCDKEFHDAFKQLEISKLPLKWKVFFMCARMKLATLIYVLLKIMTILISKND